MAKCVLVAVAVLVLLIVAVWEPAECGEFLGGHGLQ